MHFFRVEHIGWAGLGQWGCLRSVRVPRGGLVDTKKRNDTSRRKSRCVPIRAHAYTHSSGAHVVEAHVDDDENNLRLRRLLHIVLA